MKATLLALLKHRATWRFLCVLLVSLGYATLADDFGKLEVALCTVLTCVD